MLAELGVEVTLTTNGSLLAKQVHALKLAGLDRVTVSLDSLDDATFRAMNDADFPVAKVIEAIDVAAAEGLTPVKINMVVKRGVNDEHIVRMAERWRGTGHIVRFIEYMDVAAPTAGAWTTSSRRPKSCAASRRAGRSSRWMRITPEKLPSGGAMPTAAARLASSLGHAGLLLHLHAHAAVNGRLAIHLPLCGKRPRSQGAAAGGAGDERSATRSPRCGSAAPIAYSEIRSGETAKLRKVEMSYIGG